MPVAANGWLQSWPKSLQTLGLSGGATPASPADLEAMLLAIVRETSVELRRESAGSGRVDLECSLDRDLGFDSLARVELLLRIEKAFGVHPGEDALSSAKTPADLLAALRRALRASDSVRACAPAIRAEPARDEALSPVAAETLIDVVDWHARRHPDQTHIVYRGDAGEQRISYGMLWQQAQAFASGLRVRGLEPWADRGDHDAREPARQHPRHRQTGQARSARRRRQLAAALPRHGTRTTTGSPGCPGLP